MKRRQFLQSLLATVALSGCQYSKNADEPKSHWREPTAAQLAKKKKGTSLVGLIECQSYQENIFKQVKPYISQLALPDLKGKTVVIKPNMVECHPDKPIWTNPLMVAAAVELADYLGAAKIIVGEGPGHMRDTAYLLDGTGIGKIVKKLGVPFVDLNCDDLEKVANPDNFSDMDHFYLPRTIVEADAVISVPKMKTHHWVGMTASMKNLFGTVPGRRYGWPKNILHLKGINNCIIDLVHMVQPKIAFVDAIVAMEGDGPINGTAIDSGFVVLGTDLAAVDATCARSMKMDFHKLPYLMRAGKVIGNIDADAIEIIGASLDKLTRDFAKPITYYQRELIAEGDKSAS